MVNEKADDRIVHLNGLREADRLPDQALDPRAQCQMFTLQLLGKAFADLMLGWVQMAAVGAPAIREEPPDAEGLQQRFQLQERLVLPPPEDVGEDSPGSMVQGLPQPAWLLAHKISSASASSTRARMIGRAGSVKRSRKGRLIGSSSVCFLSSLTTVSLLMPSTRAVSRMPLPFRAMSTICHFTRGSYP